MTVQRDTTRPNFRLFEVASGSVSTIARLTLRDGFARETDPGGGAIYSQGNLTVTDCELTGNQAPQRDPAATKGGAILAAGGSLDVNNSSITGNSADFGGGIAVEGNVRLSVSGGVVGLNFAARAGGGIYVGYGDPATSVTLTSVEVTGNLAGGVGSAGGGVYCARATLTLTGNTDIHDNWAAGDSGQGGGVYVYAGTVNLNGVRIGNNNAAQGDGMYLRTGVTRNVGAGNVEYYGTPEIDQEVVGP